MREEVLRAGTSAHYEDAAYYDHAYRRRRHDVRFYADLAERIGGPVLELGVGTGRVAAELARRGIEVLGVDRMPAMLERAERRVARLPRRARRLVTLERADIARFRSGRRFPLVIAPFNVFMHLYTRRDVERALRTAHVHLRRDGRLVFDVLCPDPGTLARDPGRVYRGRPFVHPVDGRRHRYAETFAYDPVSQVQIVTIAYQPEDDPASATVTPLAHRQFFPAELEALLHYNAFGVEARYGDFDGEPLDAWSESQVIVARPRRARRG